MTSWQKETTVAASFFANWNVMLCNVECCSMFGQYRSVPVTVRNRYCSTNLQEPAPIALQYCPATFKKQHAKVGLHYAAQSKVTWWWYRLSVVEEHVQPYLWTRHKEREGTLFALIGLQATKKGPLKMYAKPQAKPPLRNQKLFFFPGSAQTLGSKANVSLQDILYVTRKS